MRQRVIGVAALVAAGMVAGAPAAHASPQGKAAVAATCPARSGGLTDSDVNGDGRSDLVTGLPGADHGAGAIQVNLSYSTKHADVIREGSDGMPGRRQAGSDFGFSVWVGRLNGDRCDDLAIGIPDLTVHGVKGAGGVQILFGGSKGFTAGPLLTRASPGVSGVPATNEHFGYAVDVQTNPVATERSLYIGAPGAAPQGQSGPVHGAGEVLGLAFPVASGTSLSTPTTVEYYQGHGVNGGPVAGAHLGMSLGFIGNAEGAGAPDETVNAKHDAGFWGNLLFDPASNESASGTSADERLGASITEVGGPESDSGAIDSPLVGAPGATVDGHKGAGAVIVYTHDVEEPDESVVYAETLNQDSPHVPGHAALDAHFGASVAGGQPGQSIVGAIGVPGQTVKGHRNAGAVIMLLDGDNGGATYREITQDTEHVPGTSETNDHFGSRVAFTSQQGVAGQPPGLVLVGDPGENIGTAINCGALELLPADGTASTKGARIITRPHPSSNDRFGAATIN